MLPIVNADVKGEKVSIYNPASSLSIRSADCN